MSAQTPGGKNHQNLKQASKHLPSPVCPGGKSCYLPPSPSTETRTEALQRQRFQLGVRIYRLQLLVSLTTISRMGKLCLRLRLRRRIRVLRRRLWRLEGRICWQGVFGLGMGWWIRMSALLVRVMDLENRGKWRIVVLSGR